MTAPGPTRRVPPARSGRAGALFASVAAACLAAVAIALVSQHAYGMEPCPWCVLQRMIFLAIAALALLGLAWRRPAGARLAGAFALLLALAGLASALWQHFVASRSPSCNLTLADRIVGATRLDSLLPDVFSARAACADVSVLLGVPYAVWAAALFAIVAVALLGTLREA